MPSLNTFELSKAPARVESVSNVKSSPKDENDEGALAKRVTFWVDVSDKKFFKKVLPLFPGLIDEGTPQRLAAETASSVKLSSKRKLGAMNVKVYDPHGELQIEIASSKTEPVKLDFGKEARTAWLIVTTTLALSKKHRAILDDYFKADVLLDLGVSQLDLEDAAKDKVEAKKKDLEEKAAEKAAAKAEAAAAKKDTVEWTKRTKKAKA